MVVSFLSSGTISSGQGDLRVVWWSERVVAQSCLSLCGPVDCRPPGPSVHGIQAKILEWVAIPFCRESPNPCLQHCRQVLYHLIIFSLAYRRMFMVRNAPLLHWVTSVGGIWNCCSICIQQLRKIDCQCRRGNMKSCLCRSSSQSQGSTRTIFKSVLFRIWIPQSSVWCWF